MQQNVLSQQIGGGRYTGEGLAYGVFIEDFARVGEVARAVSACGKRVIAFEVLPSSGTDSRTSIPAGSLACIVASHVTVSQPCIKIVV